MAARFSALLEMPESEVDKIMYRLEKEPLFQKMFRTRDPAWKIFKREKFPSSSLSQSFYRIPENVPIHENPSAGIEEILSEHARLVKAIQGIGRENFEKYFLYDDGEMSSEEIASALGCSTGIVREIRELADKALMRSSFLNTPSSQFSASCGELEPTVTRVVKYSPKPQGGFELELFSPGMAGGIYKINYERFQRLKEMRLFSSQENSKMQEIFKWVEMINNRKKLIFRILALLPDLQKDFFRTDDWSQVRPLSQKTVAQELQVSPSAVCRAIQNRTAVMPQGTEYFLNRLFPSRKDVLIKKVAGIIQSNPLSSDEQLRKLVHEKTGVLLSRRSVNVYRNQILAKRQGSLK